ncbi:MAG TPA: regulatory protein RecX [Bacillota bacterium]|nr:regulatory protein RecX [Bacillota bacterium]
MDEFENGYKTALRFISKRMKTEAEVRKRLNTRCPDQVTDQVIERLKDDGYLDDALYVDCYIRDRMKFNPMGRHRIKIELEQKGIIKELIENSSEYLAIDEKKVIEGLLKTKLKGCDVKDEKQKRRLLGYLVRRGFSFEAINRVLAQHFGRSRS